MSHRYSLYGITVVLPLAVAALAPAEVAGDEVRCSFGEVPIRLEACELTGPGWQASAGRFLYGAEGGRLLVESGRRVVLQPASAAPFEQRLYLMLQIGLPVALIQRGELVLHAAVAQTPAGAVAICGESGAGKSTMLAALLARGCGMLTDDIAVLRRTPDGAVAVCPGAPQLHLTQAAAERLACADRATGPQPWRRMKVALSPDAPPPTSPARLSALYVLTPQARDTVTATALAGRARLSAAQAAIAGPAFGETQALAFPTLTALLNRVGVIRIERPADSWSVAEIADLILANTERG